MPERVTNPDDGPDPAVGRPQPIDADPPIELAPFELEVNRVAKGGASLGSGPDGRTVFVSGAIPGERVRAIPDTLHKSRIEATADLILSPSPDRVDPPCSHVADGCGGCDWQHVDPHRQRLLRRDIVDDCLRRLAGMDGVDIRLGPELAPTDYRTTVRAAVVDGRAAYRIRSSNDTVAIDRCVVAHPLVEELLVEGRFGSATEVVVRAGANTGERLVVVDPTADGVIVPDGVKVVGRDELAAGRRPHYHEEIGGLRLQISADSFFQCRPDGAMALAELAGDAVADGGGTMLDAFCGVGLFGALAGIGRSVVGVESNPSAVADATYNLGPHGRVVETDFDRWQAEPVGVVIADPSRVGLRKKGCDRIAETGAALVALVSCDPASLARDATLLAERGYELDHVTVVDLFGHTSHVETVSRFVGRA
ncbi:MAG: class I SAM-dependent RNA methyltransferase [Acidimicrobiales bacterium]